MPVSVSGLASDFDSQELIKKLIEVESKPIKRMQDEKEVMGLKIEVLQELNKRLGSLENSVHNLYGINASFRNKVALRTDDSSFSAVPGPNALPGNIKIDISQIATAHTVSSDPIPADAKLPQGSFSITVGSNTRQCSFSGGTVDDLAAAVNRTAGDLVKASIVHDTETSVVFVMTSVQTGKGNEIRVSDKDGLLTALKLIVERKSNLLDMDLAGTDPDSLLAYKGYRTDLNSLEGSVTRQNNGLVLHESAKEISLKEIPVDSTVVLEVTYSFASESAGTPEVETQAPPQGGDVIFSRIDPVQIRDLIIKGAPLAVNPPETPEEQQVGPIPVEEKESGVGIAYLKNGKRTEKLFPLTPATNSVTVRFSLDKDFSALNRVVLYSHDKDRDLVISGLKIFSTRKQDKDFAKTIQDPLNAKFKINDIDVERSRNNDLTDVIRDVNLTLKAPTKNPVTFTIDHDVNAINYSANTFVSNYNRVLTFIDDIQRTSKSDKPGEYKVEDHGPFAGDMVLANIRSYLRGLVMTPFPTSQSNRLCLLMQTGISTGEWNGGRPAPFEEVKKGLLKCDEAKFDSIFRQYPKALAELFGNDVNGDMKIDTGLAFKMYEFLMGVTRPRSGVIDAKIETTKADIKNKDEQITKKQNEVNDHEDRLKSQFTEMEKNMADLKGKQRWLQQQTESQKKQE